jgi:nicotinamide mononucleotide transporter
MSVIELIAVIFSLACIWLAVKKHVLNWLMGIIGVTAYMILFYRERLYADMVLQLVFILQGIYGWYNWVKKKKHDNEIEVSHLTRKQTIFYSLLILVIAVIWSSILNKYTNASTPHVDAFVATTSLIANWLMAKKKIENWILWILADIIYIGLFVYKQLFLSSGIYVVFLVLSIRGLIDWSKKNNIKKGLF